MIFEFEVWTNWIKDHEFRGTIWIAQKLMSIKFKVLNKDDFEYKDSKVDEYWVWRFEYKWFEYIVWD